MSIKPAKMSIKPAKMSIKPAKRSGIMTSFTQPGLIKEKSKGFTIFVDIFEMFIDGKRELIIYSSFWLIL